MGSGGGANWIDAKNINMKLVTKNAFGFKGMVYNHQILEKLSYDALLSCSSCFTYFTRMIRLLNSSLQI
jgi:hypothetical protein